MKQVFAIIGLSLLVSSCEKVIPLELEDAEPKDVVDGRVYMGTGDVVVDLTKTGSYFDNEPLPTIAGATVTLTPQGGSALTLTDQGGGRYELTGYNANPGMFYTLDVNAGGQVYSATSYMPPLVVIDSLSAEFQPADLFGDEGYTVFTNFLDPEGVDNYYRLKYWVNGELQNSPDQVYLLDDGLSDGRPISFPLFAERFPAGDTITIELISMDKNVYLYYETMLSITNTNGGGGDSASPGNPESNIVGGAMGVFGAYSSDTLTIVLPS